MIRVFLVILALLALSACGGPPSLAEKVNGTWQTEGASITLDTQAGTYSALIASQQVDRKLQVVSATERTVRMLLDGERELVATFAPDSWDKVKLEQPNSWSYDFTRVK